MKSRDIKEGRLLFRIIPLPPFLIGRTVDSMPPCNCLLLSFISEHIGVTPKYPAITAKQQFYREIEFLDLP